MSALQSRLLDDSAEDCEVDIGGLRLYDGELVITDALCESTNVVIGLDKYMCLVLIKLTGEVRDSIDGELSLPPALLCVFICTMQDIKAAAYLCFTSYDEKAAPNEEVFLAQIA